MELIDFILHVDEHLLEFITNYGIWIYAILFLIIFVETGLVVMPFLPGDSLLFAAGLYWKRSSGDIETSIITREAVDSLQVIHNRSPLLLTNEQRDIWVSDLSSEGIYSEVLDYTYDDIEFHKVDIAVNNPRNNNDSLIRKYEEVPF